ncbi:hypothetical protein G7Y89_g7488 [Cudoniella acicularis]|uniref:Uncharacterized protein n=1 Tax=Cudoniella acicularis TaxID=354080 RepID=A0A8H4RKD2_9HELO|nr:hypothetical protein G7Y89_g7488 [Cudoniella acicularis]
MSFLPSKKPYSLLSGEDNTTEDCSSSEFPLHLSAKRNSRYWKACRTCIYSVVIFAVGTLLFFGGKHYERLERQQKHEDILSLPGRVPVPFNYNRTFGEAPSNQTDEAWQNIFPPKNGFFDNATTDNRRGAFAFYHQLHCLHALQIGYYEAVSAANEGRRLSEDFLEDGSNMGSAKHVRHCVDYLRQSLMCHADTNVEPEIPGGKEVVGFGTVHYCRDYGAVLQWLNEL